MTGIKVLMRNVGPAALLAAFCMSHASAQQAKTPAARPAPPAATTPQTNAPTVATPAPPATTPQTNAPAAETPAAAQPRSVTAR